MSGTDNDCHRAAAPLRRGGGRNGRLDTSGARFRREQASAARPDPGEAGPMNHVLFWHHLVCSRRYCGCCTRIEVKGLENLPRSGVLLCAESCERPRTPCSIGICAADQLPPAFHGEGGAVPESACSAGILPRAGGVSGQPRGSGHPSAVKTAMKAHARRARSC